MLSLNPSHVHFNYWKAIFFGLYILSSSTVIKGCYQAHSTLKIPNGSIKTIAKRSSAYNAETSRAMDCIEPPNHERAQVFTRVAGWLYKQTPLALLNKASRAALPSFGHSSILLSQDTVSIYNNSVESNSLFITTEARCHYQIFQIRSHQTRSR